MPKTKPRTTPPVVDLPPSRCPRCHSTERARYFRSETYALHPEDAPASTLDGKPWTHLRKSWTRCKVCGQLRIDRLLIFPRTKADAKNL